MESHYYNNNILMVTPFLKNKRKFKKILYFQNEETWKF